MAFIIESKGAAYAPGWFLATEEGVERKTRQIAQDHENVQTTDDGGKYVPGGSVYPSNDGEAEGIVYENVDVTSGDMPGSVVVRGTVYADRLTQTIAEEAQAALEEAGFVFVDETPETTRPF